MTRAFKSELKPEAGIEVASVEDSLGAPGFDFFGSLEKFEFNLKNWNIKNLAKRGYEAPLPTQTIGLNQCPFLDRVNSIPRCG